MVNKILKRDGRKEVFNASKIYDAISKAALSLEIKDLSFIDDVVDSVIEQINANYNNKNLPSVEDVQDIIEKTLIAQGQVDIAKCKHPCRCWRICLPYWKSR